jgi:hypothetical protein
MKFGFPAVVLVVASVSCANLARGLETSLVSAESTLAPRQQNATQGSNAPRNVAANDSCREVDVALDEGYGVSGYETRYQCDARVR